MRRGGRRGMILVSVLLLTMATWALLAGMLGVAFLQYRLALGAERGVVAGAAAQAAVDALSADALALVDGGHAWPLHVVVAHEGTCERFVTDLTSTEAWWRIGVRATFEGAVAWREATVHAP